MATELKHGKYEGSKNGYEQYLNDTVGNNFGTDLRKNDPVNFDIGLRNFIFDKD